MMAENCQANNGSSEESLPLSQETFNSLLNMMNLSGREEMLANFNAGNSDQSELCLVPTAPPPQPLPGAHITHTGSHYTPNAGSSLPATSNWPGNYDFKLLFGHQEKHNKQMNWTYSEVDNKLYVKKDALCPFSFQTNTLMPDGVFLRAMAVYSSPENASTVVTRCVNHSQQEIVQGIFEAEHLVRSDCGSARYNINTETKRHSVIVPFENPPVGQSYSTYIFSFLCFSSCAGGPNRRALTLVFTLEHGPNVLGRITLDLKICSCPWRDRNNAEKEKPSPSVTSGSVANKRALEPSSISLPHNFFENFPKKKKSEGKSEEKKEFTIKVKDEECYQFLLEIKRLYLTHKRLGGLSPECKAFLQMLRSSSDEECH